MTTSPKRKWNSDLAKMNALSLKALSSITWTDDVAFFKPSPRDHMKEAATDMFTALKACDQFLESISNSYEVCHHTQALIDQVKAAIAKAGAA